MSITSALPVSERIANWIFERLELLKAGYSELITVVDVKRPTRLGDFTPKHLQILLTMGARTRVPELDYPGVPPAVCWEQLFNIRCHVMPSEKDPTPVSQYSEIMAAEVVRVIAGESSQWHTFGNIAIDADWQDTEPISADGGVDGVNVPLAVRYRTDEGNPIAYRA